MKFRHPPAALVTLLFLGLMVAVLAGCGFTQADLMAEDWRMV